MPFANTFTSLTAPVHNLRRWWRPRASGVRRLSLALQGGGAHGAFTWGVLDRLLEDESLGLDAISGSSAGAVNAVLLAHGWLQGGRAGARQALGEFWRTVGQQLAWPMVTRGSGESLELTPAARMFAQWASLFPPGGLNPLAVDHLRDILTSQIDFAAIRAHRPLRLFVGATHVNTGKLRLFREHELTVDMLLASACLPRIHRTVEIDGEPYWDGGYSANPALFPLVDPRRAQDLLMVLLAPHSHDATPRTLEEIQTRIQELGFKTHFLREMQMHAQAQMVGAKSVGRGWNPCLPRFHLIDANLAVMQRSDTKLLAYTPFLEMLCGHGRERASQWLQQNASFVGLRGTADLTPWRN